ncbi:MAG: aminotransferase class V-fold PLP-dependent enzyme [Gemmatimonadetes bacterium]|nr:aminotransferase class V-fold PLP-dependent enzyme [Gemmatimonadota bacterium]
MLTSISEPQTQRIDPGDDAYWSQVRSQFITEPDHAYLNNAALGMPPKPVRDAVAAGFRLMSENPSKAKRVFQDYIEEELRPAMAGFLRAETGEIALARNATEGLYHIVNGLELAPGDRILMTTQEHPSAVKPWKVRAERDGIEIREVQIPSPLTGEDDIVERIAGAIDRRTKVFFFCHVTRGGYLYPVRRLCALARDRGLISAIDGAQAVGMLDVDLADMECDLYTNSLHKWFLGPAGTGFLYVNRALQPSFGTLYAPVAEPGVDARRYEIQGTYDLPVRAALGTALDFLNRIGICNIERRLRMLSDYLRQALLDIPRLRLLTSQSHDISSPGSTIFEFDGINAARWRGPMETEANLHVDDHDRDGHHGIRISTHYYNTTDEIDRCVDKLRDMLRREG